MAQMSKDNTDLQTWALLAVRQGRSLAERLSRIPNIPIGDLSRLSLTATLRRLEIGDITDGRDLVVFEALAFGLAEIMFAETTGSTVELQHAGYDAEGEVCSWETKPTYTGRGAGARDAHTDLLRFLELRQDLIDHSAADRVTAKLRR